VSHELRTPLTSIRGSLGLIDGGVFGSLNDEGTRATRIAVRNTDRLIRLLNDILDLERLETGRIPLERSDCDLRDIFLDALDAMQPMAEAAGVTLVVPGPDPSPNPEDPDRPVQEFRIHADPDRLVQVFTNLLSNAIKFSPPGGRVWIGAERTGNEVLAWVRDEGRGIPAEKLEHIFGRFQQVDASDSRDKGGTGLGLAICRSIAELHGGRIWVESEIGAGSVFKVTLRDHCSVTQTSPVSSVDSP
jgi:signal transduction histidine kinase